MLAFDMSGCPSYSIILLLTKYASVDSIVVRTFQMRFVLSLGVKLVSTVLAIFYSHRWFGFNYLVKNFIGIWFFVYLFLWCISRGFEFGGSLFYFFPRKLARL